MKPPAKTVTFLLVILAVISLFGSGSYSQSLPASEQDVTFTLDKTQYSPGETVRVAVSGVTQAMIDKKAWIGIYKAEAAHSAYGKWVHVKAGSSVAELEVPKEDGSYELRFYKGSSANEANFSHSVAFTVREAVTIAGAAQYESFQHFLADYKQNAELSGLTARGLPPETPTAGPVGSWVMGGSAKDAKDKDKAMPVPPVNPLGSQELYFETKYKGPDAKNTYDSIVLNYIENSAQVSKKVFGEYWELTLPEYQGDALPFVLDYAKKLGANILETPTDNELVFTLREPEGYIWCRAGMFSGKRVALQMVRRQVFQVNKEYTITADMFKSLYYTSGSSATDFEFMVEMPGKKFTTLSISHPDGAVQLLVAEDLTTETIRTKIHYKTQTNSIWYTDYVLYDFPQDAGLFACRIVPTGKTIPSKVTFMFRETEYDVPGYKPGSMGALVVKNAPGGRVAVKPQAHVTVEDRATGRSQFHGARAGDDIYFHLPAGYYTINGPNAYGSAKSQLVPVSAGELTTVSLPKSWRTASESLGSGSDDRELTGRIDIKDAIDRNKTAELVVSVFDPLDRDVYPTKDNTVITEGGKKVKIVDIRRQVAPCSVALVLDSSGSMANDMWATKAAAKKFVKSLPDSSFVKIVDFAGYVNPLPGSTKADAIKALSGIQASGSTMLYDATLEGLKQVAGKPRPAVIVFTDGVDSRDAPGTGQGSKNTKDAVVQQIQKSGIPVYAIGFGRRLNEGEDLKKVDGAPDIACLKEFAAASGGEFYPAKQTDALDAVFAAIGSKLGNNFVVTYTRPTENSISNTPVYSMMIDNSASMDMAPSASGDTGYRMEKTKKVLVDFIGKLPQSSIAQFATFQGGSVNVTQMSTVNKAELLKAVGEMGAEGGTPTIVSLKTAYENIMAIPTSNRVIVYVTDVYLGGLFSDKHFTKVLENIKEQDVHILWIGIGPSHEPKWVEAYAKAAKETDGEYVVTESAEDMVAALDKLLAKVAAREGSARNTPVTIDLSYKTEQGELVTYKASGTAKFSPPKKKGKGIEPDYIRIETGGKPEMLYALPDAGRTSTTKKQTTTATATQATPATAKQTGAPAPVPDTILFASAPVHKTMRNNAMEMTVHSVAYYDKLMGLEAAKNNYRFAAYELELKNTTAQTIPYRIPGIFKHFYMGADDGQYPASHATWMMERPVTPHGHPAITIPAGATVRGTLVFLIPYARDGYDRTSLNLYDTAFGHIQIPVSGGAPDRWLELETLPTKAPGKLSDTFSMSVTAANAVPGISQYKAGDNAVFQVVEADFQSNVQALLDINPAARIHLRYPSKSGDLMTSMSKVTGYIPFGFDRAVMVGPGSVNKVRMAYDVPASLDGYKSELYFDIATGRAVFGVTKGKTYGAPSPVAEFDTQFLKVRVNQLVQLEKDLTYPKAGGRTATLRKGSVLLDVTFIDKPSDDGKDGTRVPKDFFTLVHKDYTPPDAGRGNVSTGNIGLGGATSPMLKGPSRESEGLIFGMGDGLGVFGNMSRRAILIFDEPKGDAADWTLQSRYADNIKTRISKGDFASPELIAYRANIPTPSESFQQSVESAAKAAVKKYAVLGSVNYSPVITLDSGAADGKMKVDIPPINTYGLRRMESVKTEQDFLDLMRSINCIPKRSGGGYNYAPESVITQGWGDIPSTVNAASTLLTRLGYSPKPVFISMTDQGRKALSGYYGFDIKNNSDDSRPIGIAYQNEQGDRKMFVVPFMADIADLQGYVFIPPENKEMRSSPGEVTVRVHVRYMAKSSDKAAIGGGGLWGGVSGAAAGDTGGEKETELRMLDKKLPLDRLSTDAIDIGFISVPTPQGNRNIAYINTPGGIENGTENISAASKIVSASITILYGNQTYTHVLELKEGKELDKYLFTLGLNLPDLPAPAAAELFGAFSEIQKAVSDPDPYAMVQMFNRNVLHNFIAGQTSFDRNAVSTGQLVLGRISRPRVLMVQSELTKTGGLVTWLDLMQPFNEIHAGDATLRKGYSAASGLYMSHLESGIFPPGSATGYLDLWANAPAGTEILSIPVFDGGRNETCDLMAQTGIYPKRLLEAVKQNKKFIMVQSLPTYLNGEPHFAWLEIDPNTYETISVFGNGYHATMAEFGTMVLMQGEKSMEYLKGVWLGANVSVWSVSAYSLKFSDHKEIMAHAYAYAMYIGERLKYFRGQVNELSAWGASTSDFEEFAKKVKEHMEEGAKEKAKEIAEDAGIDFKKIPKMPNLPTQLEDEKDLEKVIKAGFDELYKDLPDYKIFGVSTKERLTKGLGFSQGYEDAVKVYFNMSGYTP